MNLNKKQEQREIYAIVKDEVVIRGSYEQPMDDNDPYGTQYKQSWNTQLNPDDVILFSPKDNILYVNGEKTTGFGVSEHGGSYSIYSSINEVKESLIFISNSEYSELTMIYGNSKNNKEEYKNKLDEIKSVALKGNKIKIDIGKAYKLNNNENTQYLVINISNDKAMLLRTNVKDDITPYVIVDEPKINNGNIEWSSGRYYKDFENAINDYVNRLNSIEVQIDNPKYRLISQDELEQMKKSDIEFNARLDIENEGKFIMQYDESNIEQVEELLNGNEHNLIR